MKNLQQNLLLFLAVCLCGLCVFQWHGQTLQRRQLERLSQEVFEKTTAIRDYTNSIATVNQQVARMDERITTLKNAAKTNAAFIQLQQETITRIEAANRALDNDMAGLTNRVAQYQKAVETLQGKLKEAYAGIEKQNAALKELTTQRDELVTKYNEGIKDRNEVVNKYNDLVRQVEKNQTSSEAAPQTDEA